jgi:hypothetical protein
MPTQNLRLSILRDLLSNTFSPPLFLGRVRVHEKLLLESFQKCEVEMFAEFKFFYLIPVGLLDQTFFSEGTVHGQPRTERPLFHGQEVVEADAVEAHALGDPGNVQLLLEVGVTKGD